MSDKKLEYWKEYVRYEQSTGSIYWLKARFKKYANRPAGYPRCGYLALTHLRKKYPIHHLIWLFETGEYPNCLIDHIDGNTRNNKISNLRKVTRFENSRNRKSHGAVKFLGVWQDKRKSKAFYSQIMFEGKVYRLGRFPTAEQAAKARDKKALELDSKHYTLNFPRSDYGL